MVWLRLREACGVCLHACAETEKETEEETGKKTKPCVVSACVCIVLVCMRQFVPTANTIDED